MSDVAGTEADDREPLHSRVPLRTMAIWLALIAVVFLTRNRWEPWVMERELVVERELLDYPSCDTMSVSVDGARAALWDWASRVPCIVDTQSGRTFASLHMWKLVGVAPDLRSVMVRESMARALEEGEQPPYASAGTPRPTGMLAIVDAETARRRFRLNADGAWACAARYSADGRSVLADHEDGVKRVWDVDTGRFSALGSERQLRPVREPVAGNAPFALHRGKDGEPRIGPDESGAVPGSPGTVGGAFSPDEKRIATWDGQSHVFVRDARTGQRLATFPFPGPASLLGENLVMYSSADGKLTVYRRVYPEYWWGVFYLRHFWLIVALGLALVLSVWKDARALRRRP